MKYSEVSLSYPVEGCYRQVEDRRSKAKQKSLECSCGFQLIWPKLFENIRFEYVVWEPVWKNRSAGCIQKEKGIMRPDPQNVLK